MKKFFARLMVVITLTTAAVPVTSCTEEQLNNAKETALDIWWELVRLLLGDVIGDQDTADALVSLFGWDQSQEDLDNIPDVVDPVDPDPNQLGNAADLTDMLPPIGNQGQYGTCVAWAVGYNLRTAMYAKDQGLSKSDLALSQNQFSPKYLFWAIDNAQKGADCNGTNFEPALDVLKSKGIATLSATPYTNMGSCTSSPTTTWDNEAANYKIAKYRQVDHKSATKLKYYLDNGYVMAIGARLGDNFMQWDDASAINSDTYLMPNMQHAYHAMALAGYNDDKQAFLVINSWDQTWGNKGMIWVDYDFFTSGNFCFAAFIADTKTSNTLVKKKSGALTADAKAVLVSNQAANDGTYTLSYKAELPQGATVAFMYYNATNVNDYGVLMLSTHAEGSFTYKLPGKLSGKYYLALYVDAFDQLNEADETNNALFITENTQPLHLADGVIMNKTTGITDFAELEASKPNTYTPLELATLLQNQQAQKKLQLIK